MKKRVLLFVVSIILIMMIATLLPVGAQESTEAADPAEQEQLDVTDSYYYDRLNETQQTYYTYLKNYFDDWQGGAEVHEFELLTWTGSDMSDEERTAIFEELIYAQMALYADEPLYEVIGRIRDDGYTYCDEEDVYHLMYRFGILESVTQDMKNRADARIEQIVAAVGEGDRYTRLRRMTAYLLDNTFYDPYTYEINGEGRPDAQKSGADLDTNVYGLLLKNIAVCDGFADSVKLLCNELDIPCIIMGNAGHAWNLVQMEDGSWYRLDITAFCKEGWDGERFFTTDFYFDFIFLNNDFIHSFGYDDPYMISLNNVPLVTEFPEHAEGQYVYTGNETNFSYSDVQSAYKPEWSKFIYRVNFDGTTCTILDYEGKESGDLIIPESIDGYTVIAIDEYAFYYCTGFTGRLVIPDTVQSIGRGAFAGCYNLTSVEFSDGLYDIKDGAFIGCKGLRELVLPDLLGRFSKYAFYDCDSLELVTFGRHVFEIDQTAFGEINAQLMMKAPEGSVAQQYAQQNGLAFEVYGEMCSFEDADGIWDFDEMKDSYWRLVAELVHFHTCEHGARFDYEAHSIDIESESANCGAVCDDCGAHFCRGFGFTHAAPKRINKTEATCSDAAYTGDLVCGYGHHIQYGEYVGEPTGKHIPANDVWQYDEYNHYNICSCGRRLEDASHSGGVATTTQKAVCDVCGVEYGDLAEEHTHLAAWQDCDEYSHYWVCLCGERLDIEAHRGGIATEYEYALCEVCGVAYGELAEHTHTAQWLENDEYAHYWVCLCGERLDIEAHRGGIATEYEYALCEVCGVAYGELAEHAHTAQWLENNEYAHYWVCYCGEIGRAHV